MCRPGRTQQKCYAGAPPIKAEYILNLLVGETFFSKQNVNSGFWQIPLDKKSSYLTPFITPFGRFRFQRLPFCISSAPEHFQRKKDVSNVRRYT
ncbi:hypothetical protein AVEN_270108-1 [Araneus ventricosus]|uniref:Reverse transcriptase domain-containing protein n=1 Tax=Araneus ventricosus TaxID=182803 RepID=A0A4Y2KDI9_ARAVE|nr:hypothetical protein AVEN_270108-1 [Araneus ventricosus]